MTENIKTKITKQCPYCKSEISIDAKKCPYCQSDLRSWFRRHPILTALGFFIMLIFVVSIIGSGTKKKSSIQKVEEVSQQEYRKGSEIAKTKEISQQKVLDQIRLNIRSAIK